MRECLKCKKSIEGKHESAKFCSTSCRVMYHRKFGNTKAVNPVQVQVLYKAMLDMVDKIQSAPPKEMYDSPPLKITYDEPPRFSAPRNALKSFEYYRLTKKQIENEEEWLEMAEEIKNATHLSEKQINILLTTNI